MGTKRHRVMVRLCVLIGTLAVLLPGTMMSASAAPSVPQYTECSSTKAVAVDAHHTVYYLRTATVDVWVTFDKLVDYHDGSWCGSIRSHAQARVSGSDPNATIGGELNDVEGGRGEIWQSPFIAAGSSGTHDSWGPWRPANCGSVLAYYIDSAGVYYSWKNSSGEIWLYACAV